MLSIEEIEKIKEGLRKQLFNTTEANKCGLSTNDFKEDIEILEGAIQYIDQLENQIQAKEMEHKYDIKMIDEVKGKSVKLYKEINKQNKIIDEMVEHIVSSAIVDDTVCSRIFCEVQEDCSHKKMLSCTKQYFEKKAEGKNE